MNFGIESFNAQLAHRIGIKEAIFVYAIEEALDNNSAFTRIEEDGRILVRIPYRDLEEHLFFFSGESGKGIQDEIYKVMRSAINQNAVYLCEGRLACGQLWFGLPADKRKP